MIDGSVVVIVVVFMSIPIGLLAVQLSETIGARNKLAKQNAYLRARLGLSEPPDDGGDEEVKQLASPDL